MTVFLKTGKPLTFNLVIQTAEFPSWKDKAEKFNVNLKAGIKLNVKTLDSQSYYDTLWTKKIMTSSSIERIQMP